MRCPGLLGDRVAGQPNAHQGSSIYQGLDQQRTRSLKTEAVVQCSDGGIFVRRTRVLQMTILECGAQQGMPRYKQRRLLMSMHRAGWWVKGDDPNRLCWTRGGNANGNDISSQCASDG